MHVDLPTSSDVYGSLIQSKKFDRGNSECSPRGLGLLPDTPWADRIAGSDWGMGTDYGVNDNLESTESGDSRIRQQKSSDYMLHLLRVASP